MLELNNITKKFSQEAQFTKTTLTNISLTIQPQSFTVITGTGKSGKTTLLNLISGELQPNRGTIYLNAMDITKMPECRRARLIGHVFTSPAFGTIPELTVMENMLLAKHRGWLSKNTLSSRDFLHHKITEELKMVDMDLISMQNRPVRELSNGQRQALALLMATAGNQKFLLLDDHTAGLEALEEEIIIRLTIEIIASKHLTAIMTTNSLHLAVRLGDRLLMMHNGRIIFDAGGIHKKKVRSEDLINLLQEERRLETIDENTASMLEKKYI